MTWRAAFQQRRTSSLSRRIAAGFGLVLAFHVVVVVTGHLGLNRAQTDLRELNSGRRLSLRMVEIDRLVGEMQRHVMAYTFTGHAGSEARTEQAYVDLETCIREARELATGTAHEALDDMSSSLRNYRATFRLAVDDRSRRKALLDGDLVELTERALAAMETAVSLCTDDDGRTGVIHRSEVLLLHAVTDAHDYLSRLEPEAIESAQSRLAEAGGILEGTEWSSELAPHIARIENAIGPLRVVMRNLQQSTRSYLHLVNVVLAAEAEAFLRRSSDLREAQLGRLDELQDEIAAEQAQFQWLNGIISIITITLGFVVSSLIGRSVVKPLRATTATLVRLAAGARDIAIPGRDRNDEIGAMATAAQVFSERNEETAELLEATQVLSHRHEAMIEDLEQTNQSLDNFVYIASHDLRAPLRAMHAAVDWIEEDCGDDLSDSGREHIELLRGRVRRMNRLLQDILDYSRASRDDFQVEALELRTVILDVMSMFESRDSVVLTGEIEAATVQTRRVPLERVLANLIDNAIKHHDRKDEVRVAVTAKIVDGSIELTVADNGPGIPPEYRDEIFEPFRALQSRDCVEGSGVGLALVSSFVARACGRVEVEDSSFERGVAFRVLWPLSDSNPTTDRLLEPESLLV